MVEQILHDKWLMHSSDSEHIIPASVPGSVYADLLAAGEMEDPYYRDNELEALKIMNKDYVYETSFEVQEEILRNDRVVLRFDGIDTVADIYLNGHYLAYVDNMHRIWEFQVKQLLCTGINNLKVYLHSPTRFIAEQYERNPVEGTRDAMKGFPSVRKAHCMFGWDWGIRLPDAGIWRDVKLLGYSHARIDGVYITQEHRNDQVKLHFRIDEETVNGKIDEACCLEAETGVSYCIAVEDPEGKVIARKENQNEILISDPQLWWPNGYGSQPLYTVCVQLMKNGVILDEWKKRIGLRTVTMCTEKDEYGECFAHQVNGMNIFAMGADYIPEDAILSRMSGERTRELLQQAKNANFNCIRVWGGGHYPSDDFWDACDELGLLVWQDFMFACAVYDLTDEFEENIIHEFEDNIKRIRHHASLGLWCGNNEMELFVDGGEWVTRPKQKSDYVKMYEYIIPKVLKKYDPNTFYWPASPSSGGAFDNPNDENRGDVHYWEVWHGNRPFTEYRKYFFRYLSEFGFQSFPALKTCESFTEPGDRNIFSYVMEKHQRNEAANGKILNYMEQMYLYPTEFSTLLYASQLLQAQAIRYGVEHFRRNRGRCMGTIVWQLNDCWPVASWSSIDYFGRWKALHYYEKRFFAPLLLSCEEEGIMTQDMNPNAEPYYVKKSVRFNVNNESLQEKKVVVFWQLRNVDGTVKYQAEETVQVPPLSSVWLDKIELEEAELYEDYVLYELREDQRVISRETLIFCQPKNFCFRDPKLQYRIEGDEVVVYSSAYAKDVEILNENEDLILQDNYFDMIAGEERRIKIVKGEPKGIHLRSVFDIR